ncbi:MAG: RpiB/LacA/LacB family sugar-phosphate isomerase, partial [Actinomyces sp.]
VALVSADEPWPDVGRAVATRVAAGAADLGVVCCFTGTGASIAANKVAGVRAALCTDAETARGARRWNDANVVALSLRLTTETLAAEILDAFCETGPDPDEETVIARVEAVADGDEETVIARVEAVADGDEEPVIARVEAVADGEPVP